MQKKSEFSALALILLVAGCGGGNDSTDGNGSDDLYAEYVEARTGYVDTVGFRISAPVSSGAGCMLRTRTSLDDLEVSLKQTGGIVTAATDTKWCSFDRDYERCIVRVGNAIVEQAWHTRSDWREIELTIPNLAGDKRSVFRMEDGWNRAYVTMETPDFSVESLSECRPGPVQSAGAISGNWKGVAVKYDPATLTGTAVTGTMICGSGTCTISGGSIAPLTFNHFGHHGVWELESDTRLAGLAMSHDGTALAGFVCSKPLVDRDALPNCTALGFERM